MTALTEKSDASIVFFSTRFDCDDGCSGEVVFDDELDSFEEFVEFSEFNPVESFWFEIICPEIANNPAA